MAVTEKADFYVSVAGQDHWSGTLAAPNAEGSDGPFATIERAQQTVREQDPREGPVTVRVRGGEYFLEAPLRFGPEDSRPAGAPAVYAAYPGEVPLLSAGAPLNGWEPTEVNGHAAWVAPAPGWEFRGFFVNGERRARSRLPREGVYRLAGAPDLAEEFEYFAGQRRFLVQPGEVRDWHNLTAVEMVMLNYWAESRMPLATVDEKQGLVTTSRSSVFSPQDTNRTQEGAPFARYYVENVFEALEPGEWYLDSPGGKVYYLPLAGETPETARVTVSRLPFVMRIEGDVEEEAWVDNLEFRGLVFAHNEWIPPEGYKPWGGHREADVAGDSQAAVTIPGAVYATGARYCVFERCTVQGTGTYGLELGRGCSHNRMRGCLICDLDGGGVKIGTTSVADTAIAGRNEVSDCVIRDGGKRFHAAIGLWVGHSGRNLFAHNEIADFYYSGVSVGWTWGYRENGAKRNVFEYNHIHDIGKGLLSDMGGIYTLGPSEGTVIRHNRIHDVESYDYGGWGLYHDEGSTGILNENNLVYRCKSQSFHQHYGRENVLRNNILALAREQQIGRTREEEHLSFTLERNVIYFEGGPVLWGKWENGNFRFRRNLYWATSGEPLDFAGKSFAAWQATGQEEGSVVADPGFRDPEAGDFTLPPDSPAREIGFEPFDLSTVGPRGPVGAGGDDD